MQFAMFLQSQQPGAAAIQHMIMGLMAILPIFSSDWRSSSFRSGSF
jgi:hypothetical protein